jgi:Outer membrane protein beta-barrel domain
MIINRLFIIVFVLMINNDTYAQQTIPKDSVAANKNKKKAPKSDSFISKVSITGGAGVASYFGDLIQYNKIFSQPGISVSAGASYAFSNYFGARLDVGYQQLKAADSKNKGSQYKARNLSFKANVYDVSASAEVNLLNMKKYPFSPYVSAGVGVLYCFSPYTNDASGNKQYLRKLGTEGQLLPVNPDFYSKTAVIIPVGFGFKYTATKKIILKLDFSYRFTGTDYLDDVSKNGYPDKAQLDARFSKTAKFTWRGNEVGAGPYPTNLKLPRGNPDDKDGYYTTQFKVAYKL